MACAGGRKLIRAAPVRFGCMKAWRTTACRRSGVRRSGVWLQRRVCAAALDRALEHHHVHRITCCYVLLIVVQHDQAIGVGHGAEDARALVAGDADLQ